ncbi:MAG: response regulator transcription factor, partial [Burkholderiaceae bacterium]
LGMHVAAPADDDAGKPLMVVSTQEGGITANWFVAIDDRQDDGQTGSRIGAALGQRDAVLELIQSLRGEAAAQGDAVAEPARELPDIADLMRLGLTLRQSEVLLLLAEGLTNKEIARRLDVSEWTVRHHVSSILERLEVSNRGRAAIFARKLGQPGP